MEVLVGKCMDMCPKEELNQHTSGLINQFECDKNGKFRPELAIKAYNRSGAGTEIISSRVRPLSVLTKTLNHIINYVIRVKMNTSPDTTELKMYQFVRDRLRSVRSDVKVQFLSGEETIHILETSLLFFVWAGTRFHECDRADFDSQQNTEQITQTLLSLDQQYDQYLLDNGVNFPNESFFRALNLVTYLDYPGFMPKLAVLSNFVVSSYFVQKVLEIRRSILNRDFTLFLSILENDVPVQMASYILQRARVMWEKSGFILRKSFTQKPFPVSFIVDFLSVPGSSLKKWFSAFSVVLCKDDSKFCQYDLKGQLDTAKLPVVLVPDFLVNKNNTLYDIVNFLSDLPLQISSYNQQIPITNQNDLQKKAIAQPMIPNKHSTSLAVHPSPKQPLLNSATNKNEEEENEENENQCEKEINYNYNNKLNEETNNKNEKIIDTDIGKEKNDVPKSPRSSPPSKLTKMKLVSIDLMSANQKEELTERREERGRNDDEKNNTLKTKIDQQKPKKSLILTVREMMSMIPYKIPPFSHVCVLLIANDDTKSALFATSRFAKNSNTKSLLFCGKFVNHSNNGTVFAMITEDKNQLGICSILDCNEIEDFVSDINPRNDESSDDFHPQTVKFYAKSGFSPVLAFNSALRKAIDVGLTEIRPYNISNLVMKSISELKNIVLMNSWKSATANSVFEFLNNGIEKISSMIIDDNCFIQYVLPFEHNELKIDDVKLYSQKVGSLKFSLIEKSRSRSCLTDGTTWPIFITERVKVTLPNFFLPMCVRFNETKFVENMLNSLPSKSPTENVMMFY